MRRLLDERIDETAAGAHANWTVRLLVTLGIGGIAAGLVGWRLAIGWTLVMVLLEAWNWFATRRQHLGVSISYGQRAAYFANMTLEYVWWFALGLVFWRSGSAEGALCGVAVWLGIISFAQCFAYQSPQGFFVGGVAPALGMLAASLLAPFPSGPGGYLVSACLLLAALFIASGARTSLAARRRFIEISDRLKAGEAEYRFLANNIDDVIALSRANGARYYISPSIEKTLGHKVEDLLRTPNYAYLHPDDADRVKAAIASLSREHPECRLDYRVLRKDGGITWAETVFKRVPDDDPVAPGDVLSVSRAIDARKAMEAELVEARERAESAALAKADFLANVTHELRTPLNAIIGFSGLLRESPTLRGKDARQARLIYEASASLLELVNSVLDFSKVEAGALELDPRPFDPHDWMEATVDLVRQQAEARGLSMVTQIEGPRTELVGDAARLRQVLVNLLSNAVKFTAKGGVTVAALLEPCGVDRAVLRLEVRDTGVGIAADQMDILFERFSQADATISRKFGGTGLGLAISKRIIELMRGRIGVASEEGRGSTFWFEVELPVADQAEPPVEPQDEAAGLERPLRLLLVEDVQVNRELVLALLAPFDVEVVTADDGLQALERVREGRYDLILMDVQMPVMDGLTATRRIRAMNIANAAAPIIAMTANVLPEQIQRCLDAGMDDHVGKPLSPASLLGVLHKWVDGDDASGPRAPEGVDAV